MSANDRLRFGICTDQTMPFDETVDRWRMFEELGFDSIWDGDHFNRPSDPAGPYFEGWTLLSALAARTTRVRIGVLVSSNTFRHPALLAQQAVTVDHVSGGRLELGLGAGWFEAEHERFGIDLPDPGPRVDRFREAVEIVDALLRNESTTYHGDHYRLESAHVRPRPVQQPRPPLTLGAHGSRMLRICAEYADAWNSFGSIEQIARRNQILDRHCADIGRDPGEIRRSFYGWASNMTEQGLPDPWESADAFADVIGSYREVGIDEFIIDQPRPGQQKVLEEVAGEVIPVLRAGGG